MADAAYTLDFSPIGNIGKDYLKDKQEAAYKGEQIKNMQSEAAYRGAEQKNMEITSAANQIKLEEEQKKQKDLDTPMPVDGLVSAMKEKGFGAEADFMMNLAKPYIKNIAGQNTITKRQQGYVKEMLQNDIEKQKQFAEIHVNNLSNQITEWQKDKSELQEKLNSKLDRNGKPEPNPKLEAQVKQLDDKIKGGSAQVRSVLYATSEAERTRVAKEEAAAQKEKAAADLKAEEIKARHEDVASTNESRERAAAKRGSGTGKEEARLDKSYQFNSTQLEKLEKPLDDLSQRIGRLKDTINQTTPQADALIAPEMLTVMAGGQGSGMRMNEAEISRIVGGRSNMESIKAALNKWQADPTKALSVTPEQRRQMKALVEQVDNKLTMKKQIIDQANQDMTGVNNVEGHRKIIADAKKKLTEIDSGRISGAAAIGKRPLSSY